VNLSRSIRRTHATADTSAGQRADQGEVGYPCVKDTATARCDYKAAHLVSSFGLLADGRVAYVTVTKSAPWQIYDDYAVNAVHLASPFRQSNWS